MTYSVKRKPNSRYTFRIMGIILMVLGVTQIAGFILIHGNSHMVGTIICALLGAYGAYMFVHSFNPTLYNIIYEFNEDNIVVKTKKKERVYKYSDITTCAQIIPENEMVYSIIHLAFGKDDYVIPFSYKKEVSDKIYADLNSRMATAMLAEEVKESSKQNE